MRIRFYTPRFLLSEDDAAHSLGTDTLSFNCVANTDSRVECLEPHKQPTELCVTLWCRPGYLHDACSTHADESTESGKCIQLQVYMQSITHTSCNASAPRLLQKLSTLVAEQAGGEIDIEVMHPLQHSALEHMLEHDTPALSAPPLFHVLCAHTAGILNMHELQDMYEAEFCEEGLDEAALLVLVYSIRYARLSPMMYALAELKRQGVGQVRYSLHYSVLTNDKVQWCRCIPHRKYGFHKTDSVFSAPIVFAAAYSQPHKRSKLISNGRSDILCLSRLSSTWMRAIHALPITRA
jgi:hypothetical protein